MNLKINKKTPKFIVVGGHRCGTTYLYENLIEHPEIYLNPEKKELHFFDRDENFDKGLTEYQNNFLDADNKLIGEITPNYFANKKVPERIFNSLKEVKLVVILRNPVKRSFSHYKLFQSNIKKYQKFSFQETINVQYDKIIRESMYTTHLKEYKKYFSDKKIHVIIFEEMMIEKEKTFRNLFKFLDVDSNFVPPYIEKKINAAGSRKHNSKYYVLYLIQRLMKKFNLKKYSYLIDKVNRKEQDPILEKDRMMLENLFKQDKIELQLLLNKNLDVWKF